MTAIDRLNALMEHLHTNIKAFSEMCGYERPQAFYDILKGKTKNISASMCDKILGAFPNVNRVWLLTGEGEITKAEADNEKAKKGLKMVPLVHVNAMAGPISAYYEDGESLSRCERVYSPSPMAELAVPINGDSMEPLFPNGSVVFISRINESAFIPWGHPLVLETENGAFIKNVLPDEDNPDYIWAQSLNPKYPPMHIPKASIYKMYRVLNVQMSFVTM